MTTVIKVENLSKKYILNHKHQAERYVALRDVVTNSLRNIFGEEQKSHINQEEFWALKDLCFEINQGDRVGIIGRNGAGKSTLLKVLSRIVEPTSGRIKMKGRVASLLEVGTGFHPELTGRENIFLNGTILGMSKNEIKSRFDEIIDFSGVEQFLDTPVKRYSSGMYVRLAFAVAAHLEPDILVIDEVLAVGDISFQKKCFNKIENASKDGKTVLFVSHNLTLLQHLCSRGILLDKGNLIYDSAIDGATNKYLELHINNFNLNSSGLIQRRLPTATPIFKTFKILDSHRLLPTDIIACGDDMIIEIDYDCQGRNVSSFMIALSYAGSRVTTISSDHQEETINIHKDHGRIRCRIPALNLAPRTYMVSLWDNGSDGKTNDYLEDFCSITIVDNNYFGSGKVILPEQGFIAQKSDWNHI